MAPVIEPPLPASDYLARVARLDVRDPEDFRRQIAPLMPLGRTGVAPVKLGRDKTHRYVLYAGVENFAREDDKVWGVSAENCYPFVVIFNLGYEPKRSGDRLSPLLRAGFVLGHLYLASADRPLFGKWKSNDVFGKDTDWLVVVDVIKKSLWLVLDYKDVKDEDGETLLYDYEDEDYEWPRLLPFLAEGQVGAIKIADGDWINRSTINLDCDFHKAPKISQLARMRRARVAEVEALGTPRFPTRSYGSSYVESSKPDWWNGGQAALRTRPSAVHLSMPPMHRATGSSSSVRTPADPVLMPLRPSKANTQTSSAIMGAPSGTMNTVRNSRSTNQLATASPAVGRSNRESGPPPQQGSSTQVGSRSRPSGARVDLAGTKNTIRSARSTGSLGATSPARTGSRKEPWPPLPPPQRGSSIQASSYSNPSNGRVDPSATKNTIRSARSKTRLRAASPTQTGPNKKSAQSTQQGLTTQVNRQDFRW
jgi:hypothetical protein